MKLKFLLALLVIICFFASCTIEKRKYLSGYHVEWHHTKSNDDTGNANTPAPCQLAKHNMEGMVSKESLSQNEPVATKKDTRSLTKSQIEAAGKKNSVPTISSQKPTAKNFDRQKKTKATQQLLGFISAHRSDDVNQQSRAGNIVAYTGFIFAFAALAMFVIAIAFDLGWTSLGLFALAFISGLFALLFGLVALIIFRRHEDKLPWHLYFTLLIGILCGILGLRLLYDYIIHR